MRLSEYLASIGTSGNRFGADLGVHGKTVSRWIHGERIPQGANMAMLVAATRGRVGPLDFYSDIIWQPIETALDDGAEMLLALRGSAELRVGSWDSAQGFFVDAGGSPVLLPGPGGVHYHPPDVWAALPEAPALALAA